MKKIVLLLTLTCFISCATKKNSLDTQYDILNQNKKPNERIGFQFELAKKALMPSGAYDFGAEIYNGKIYAFLESARNLKTSNNINTRNGVVCVYDISNDKWEIINKISKRQKGASSTIIKNKIYLVGGYDNDLIQVYNIETNKWEKSFKLPFKFHFTTVESYGNKIYTFGGYAIGRNVNQSKTLILDDVHIYDITTKEWTKGMPYHRRASGLNSLKYNDDFYVWSRYEMYKYSPKNDIWSIVRPLMNKMKYSQEGAVLNNKFYFTNGINSGSSRAKSSKKIFSYDPRTTKFNESIDTLIYGRKKSYKIFGYDSKLYILGGKNDEFEGSIAIDDLIEIQVKN